MDIKKFYSMCMNGNLLKAIDYLSENSNEDDELIMLEKRYKERFINRSENYEIETEDPWIKNIISCYFEYFCSVLTNNSLERAEEDLLLKLSKSVGVERLSSLDEVEEKLESIFKEKDYSFLGGVTTPYRGPYIWKTTIKKEFKVSIPNNEQNVVVYFISDFLMLGWLHFVTIGRHYPGGWAQEEGLYYVNNEDEEIDTNSIEFQIWFLKHEAQHLSDYKRFPNLKSIDLEYRAKLVELIYHPETHKIIKNFKNEAENDRRFPHPYAAYSIIKNLSYLIFGEEYVRKDEKWEEIEADVISKSSLELFLQNTLSLQEAGSETEGII